MAAGFSSAALPGSTAYILSASSPEKVTANLNLNNVGEYCVCVCFFLVISLSITNIFYHLAQSKGVIPYLMFGEGKIPWN